MSVQITIIGLGQIGASVGLALAPQTELLHRVGHDRDIDVARRAEKLGALDQISLNLIAAVRDADLVLLSLPMDQIQETLALIAPELKEGAVVMDTGPVKETVAAWAGEMLPNERYYVGLTPVINPAYLHDTESGLEAARADLFQGGLIGIVSPTRTTSEAIKLAADLTRLLGATPLFVDPLEIDSLMAATHVLPQLLAAALLNSTIDQPGWREGRKIAGRAYAEGTAPLTHLDEPQTLAASALLNRENILRVIDGAIAALQALRSDIDNQDSVSLKERLERAHQGRKNWWQQRQASDFNGENAPSNQDTGSQTDILGRLLGFGRRPKKK